MMMLAARALEIALFAFVSVVSTRLSASVAPKPGYCRDLLNQISAILCRTPL